MTLEFAKVSGLLIEELGLLARSCILVNEEGIIEYIEVVEEVSHEPNYQAVLERLTHND